MLEQQISDLLMLELVLPAADVVQAVGSLAADIVGHAVPAAAVIVRANGAADVVQMESGVGAETLANDDDVAEDAVIFVARSVVSCVACLQGVVRRTYSFGPSSMVACAVAKLVVYLVMKNQKSPLLELLPWQDLEIFGLLVTGYLMELVFLTEADQVSGDGAQKSHHLDATENLNQANQPSQ